VIRSILLRAEREFPSGTFPVMMELTEMFAKAVSAGGPEQLTEGLS